MGAIILGNQSNVELSAPSIGLTGVNVVEEIPISVNMNHGRLSGLTADDHTQYHNNARGDARYYQIGEFWEDLRVPVTAIQKGGTNDPDFERFRRNTGGTSEGVFTYFFDRNTEEELFFVVQLPHNYKYGTDLKPHAHWAVDTYPGSALLDGGWNKVLLK